MDARLLMGGEIFRGQFRVYFNNAEDHPLIWSIDNGDTVSELCVSGITIEVPVIAKYKDGDQPKAWVEGSGVVTVSREDYTAIITAE